MRLKSTVTGGSATNFLADLVKNKKKQKGKTFQNERCASAVQVLRNFIGELQLESPFALTCGPFYRLLCVFFVLSLN